MDFTHIQLPDPVEVKRADFARDVKKTGKRHGKNLIGPKVRQLRLRAVPPMSQEDLAGRLAAAGVSLDRTAVSRIEGQDRYVMDYEAVALAAALRVAVAKLFEG